MRLAGFSHPLPYYPDEFCAARLQPGFKGWWSKEGASRIEINSAGFRDREHTLQKPPGVIRVAVLGDSYIEAFQVPQQAMFGSVLEQQLNDAAAAIEEPATFEVLSFGVSGYSTAQELLALRHHVWQFDPDIVLLAFLPANDVRGNWRNLEPNDRRPFFELIDNQPVADFRFREDPIFQYAWTRECQLKTALINASRVLQLFQVARQRDGDTRTDSTATTEVGLDDECFRPPQTDDWKSAWQITERLIEQMHTEVTQHGRQFAVAVVTSSQQVHPEPDVRQAYQQRLDVQDLEYANRRIRNLGQRVGFETVILSAPLRRFAERTGRFVHGFHNTQPGFGHWNEDGHREAAKACVPTVLTLALTGEPSTKSEQTTEEQHTHDRRNNND
ncbi:MAG: SGNH/GDSL hydrolase family protein [Planctomycetota bacterium]